MEDNKTYEVLGLRSDDRTLKSHEPDVEEAVRVGEIFASFSKTDTVAVFERTEGEEVGLILMIRGDINDVLDWAKENATGTWQEYNGRPVVRDKAKKAA